MNFKRSSGIILHPSSFPGQFGIGDIGPFSYQWIDFLDQSGCDLWQVLPLGQTGYGDSPYQCFSAFAGNSYLISPELLLEDNLLQPKDLSDIPPFPTDHVDFGKLIPWKISLLDLAYERFVSGNAPFLESAFNKFRKDNYFWLDDYALFMAIKAENAGAPWASWPVEIRDRKPESIIQEKELFKIAYERQLFQQFIFTRQWANLRQYAHSKGITLIGDAPIFVAHDSSDVWAHPELFFLNPQGKPTVVAGVPPDYFSATGQLWGNPLYRWPIHQQTGYSWWIARLKSVLSMVDVIRLDHFRGFAGYWEVAADLPTAEKGRWVPGPGADFFNIIKSGLGDLPLIAEDLGEITPDVIELRDMFNLPGMKILQFAFGDNSRNAFLPHNFSQNFVAYTGTHDNDTTPGWFCNAPRKEVDYAIRYLGLNKRNARKQFTNALIRSLWGSVAIFSIAPMQDFLNLGSQARMNYPGKPSGNWSWRMPEDALSPDPDEENLLSK